MTADKAPDAFRTISEAAEDLGLEQHVLRFWETRFVQIKPLKRGGGRRYYRPDDVDFLRGLKHLLHDERYTIKGVQKIIKDQGIKAVIAAGRGAPVAPPVPSADAITTRMPLVKSAKAVAPSAAPAAAIQSVAVKANAGWRERLDAAMLELQMARQALASV